MDICGLLGIKLCRVLFILGVFFGAVLLAEDSEADGLEGLPSLGEGLEGELDMEFDGSDELMDLLAVIEEETEVATQTRMNADYVPGMLTVLHGEEMEALGALTVAEALNWVPGISVSYNNFGEIPIVIRGIGNVQHTAYVKMLLNSVSVQSTGEQRMALLTIPIEQVDRIEVIRGPGSSNYGEDALAGVINIITRRGKMVYAGVGEHNSKVAGGYFSHEDESGWGVYGNFSILKTDGSRVNSGPDRQTGIQPSYAPGPIDDPEDNKFALLGFDYKNTSVLWQFTERELGDFYGLTALPPPSGVEDGYDRQVSLTLQQKLEFTPDLNALVELGFKEHDFNGPLHFIAAAGTRFPPNSPFITPFDLFASRAQRVQRWEAGVDFRWDGLERHDWLVGVSYSTQQIRDAFAYGNVGPPPSPVFSKFEGWLPKGESRGIASVTIQDQFQLTDKIELTGSFRYDRISDTENSLSSRFAGVWRVNDSHLIKVQYAEAFRPPSFIELFEAGFSRDLEPETLEAVELGYIYRGIEKVGRITLFHQDVRNLISRRDGPFSVDTFFNRAEVEINGVEAEWEQVFFKDWKVISNISYVHTEDKSNGQREAGASTILGNVAVMGKLTKSLLATARWRHVGDVQRFPRDRRKDLSGFNTFDFSLSYSDFLVDGLTFRVGVQNAFDEEVRHLAITNTYPNGLARPGSTWWARVSYEF